MSHCQMWDCVWHGTETAVDAPMCDYCVIHTNFYIPEDDAIRGCPPGDENTPCEKYRPGDTIEYVGNMNTGHGKYVLVPQKLRRIKPSPEQIKSHQQAWKIYQTKKLYDEEMKKKRCREKKAQATITIDAQKAEELYLKNFNDTEIALALGCSRYAVTRWRQETGRAGYYNINKPDSDCTLLKQYLAEGMTDREIARKLEISKSTVGTRRRRLGLPSNNPSYKRGRE